MQNEPIENDEIKDIEELIDWVPLNTKATKSALSIRGSSREGFIAIMADIARIVENNPYICITDISRNLGCEESRNLCYKYINKNPRFKDYLISLRSRKCEDAVYLASETIHDILKNWKRYVAEGQGKLVQWAGTIALTHNSAKTLGYSAENASSKQFIVINKTKEVPEYTEKDLENV